MKNKKLIICIIIATLILAVLSIVLINMLNKEKSKEITESTDIFVALYDNGELVFSNNEKNIDMSKIAKASDINCINIKNLDFSKNESNPWEYNKIKSVTILNKIKPNTTAYWFSGCDSLEYINNIELIDTSNVENMDCMFYECEKLEELDLSSFDTSNVTNMDMIFFGCDSLKNLNLSNWNLNKVESFEIGCENLIDLQLNNVKTNNITNMGMMFSGCKKLKKLDLSSFDTSNVTNMNAMFYGCESLEEINLSSFNTNNVSCMQSMFSGCKNLKELDLSNFDFGNIDDMIGIFNQCENLKNISGNFKEIEGNMMSNKQSLIQFGTEAFNGEKSFLQMINNFEEFNNIQDSEININNMSEEEKNSSKEKIISELELDENFFDKYCLIYVYLVNGNAHDFIICDELNNKTVFVGKENKKDTTRNFYQSYFVKLEKKYAEEIKWIQY